MTRDAGGGEHIELRVESLEFEGFEVREPARVQLAFISELTRLLETRGLPQVGEGPARAELDGGTLGPAELGTPERLGQAVAHRVYGQLTTTEGEP